MKIERIKEDLVKAGVIDLNGNILVVKKPSNAKSGQPTKLTRKRTKIIIELIKQGTFIVTACKEAGISRACLDHWFKEACKGDRKALRFFLDLDKAAAELEGNLSRRLAKDPDWRAALKVLERMFGERWAEDKAPVVQVNIEGAAKLVAQDRGVPDDKLAELETVTAEILEKAEEE